MTDLFKAAELLQPNAVCAYLRSRGWNAVRSRRQEVAIFRSPSDPPVEVQVPLDHDLADYADAMSRLVSRIASYEGRPQELLLRELAADDLPVGHVWLRRRFRDVKDDPVDPLISMLSGSGVLDWEHLLPSVVSPSAPKRSAVVVFAPSGMGKTSELRAQVLRLRQANVPVFFMRAIDVALHGVDAAVDDLARLTAWRRKTDRAVFLLDAIDEARVEGHDFEHVIGRFARALDATSRKLTLVITSRNDVWSGDHERHLVGALGLDIKASAPRLVTMQPLDEEDIRAFAQSNQVKDVEALVDAIAEEELVQLLQPRPPDVRLLVEYWKQHGRFASWSGMLEESILASIRDENRRHRDQQVFTPADARVALRRLAAATQLSGRPLISLPGTWNEREVCADRLFPEWVPTKTSQLLAMGLFAPKGASSVQLREGAVSEFLAAEWLAERQRAGYETEVIEQQLLVRPFGVARTFVPTARLALLGWLAGQIPTLRRRLLAELPHVLLFEGDASRLSGIEAADALRAVVAMLRDSPLETRPTRGTLRQVAKHELEDVVVDLLTRGRGVSKVEHLLLRLAFAGKYAKTAGIALEMALDAGLNDNTRAEAIELVGEVGTAEQRRGLLALVQDRSSSVRLAVVEALSPDVLSGESLVEAVLSLPGKQEVYSLRQMLKGASLSDIDRILERLVSALDSSVIDSSTEGGLTLAVSLLGARLQRSVDVLPDWVGVLLCVIESRLESQVYVPRDDVAALEKLLSSNARLRQELWRAKIVRAVSSERMGRFFTPKLGAPKVDDVDWLVAARAGASDARLRDALMWSIRLALSGLAHKDRTARLALLQTDAELRTFLDAPTDAEAIFEKRRRQQEARDARKKVLLREKNIKALASRVERIVAGDDEHALTWAWPLLEGPTTRYERIGTAQLIESVGDELAEKFVFGFRKWWRRYQPSLPVPGENSTPFVVLAGLSGIYFDVEAGLELAALSSEDARRAAIYALHEINGLPSWFERLMETHPLEVREILGSAARNEWVATVEHHGVLSRAPYEPEPIAVLVSELVGSLMRQGQPGDARNLRHAVNALLVSPERAPDVADVLRERLEEAVAASAGTQAEWLRGWTHFAPEVAAAWLERLRGAAPADFDALTARVAAGLEQDLGDRPRTRANYAWTPHAFESWTRLLHAAVRREEDIVRPSGRMFSPGERDQAQTFRNRCLVSLARDASHAARDALLRLRDTPELHSCRDIVERGLELQLAVAADAAATPWSEQDILLVESGDERPPRSVDELCALVRAHLRRVATLLENDDFSYAGLFAEDVDEQEIQRWVASSLMLVNRGLYNVEREPEVQDQNLMDISVSAPGVGRVPIEIKPLYRTRYTVSQLEDCIREQLLGRYMRPSAVTHGVLLLVPVVQRAWRVAGRQLEFGTLVSELEKYAEQLGAKNGKNIFVATVDIAAARAKRSTVPEKSRS